MNNPWIVGGNEIHGFVISRLARPHDKAINCARQWIENKNGTVKTFRTRETAEKLAEKLNKQAKRVENLRKI